MQNMVFSKQKIKEVKQISLHQVNKKKYFLEIWIDISLSTNSDIKKMCLF